MVRPTLTLLLCRVFLPALLLGDQLFQRSEWSDFPQPAQTLARQLGLTATEFGAILSKIDRETEDRLHEGEFDHLIYYMLQSKSFTNEPLIEPAKSAVGFIKDRKIPMDVDRRIVQLTNALSRPSDDRQRYFSELVSHSDAAQLLRTEYMRAMKFLYDKEIGCRSEANPQACVASLYSHRGHSSDTSTQSQIVIKSGLNWLRDNQKMGPIHQVLIIGPGVDFAPRTGFHDDTPQVYQPRAVAQMFGRSTSPVRG